MKSLNAGGCLVLLLGIMVLLLVIDSTNSMSAEEKMKAKDQVVELFYHAYNAYMDNAYPADELMPLSCRGRYRGSEPSRGDVDDSLGNFTLTLIDTLDTLAVFGDVEGFEEAVRNIIKDARFDCDVIVSVFETNIRILGGLLGGHVMASYFKRRGTGLSWYNNELLTRAKEVGDRLLPAFNTSTGIPYPRINLKHGVVPQISSSHRDTCTACAGSMILEFAALSRLTGISVYEEKARKAMDYLWHQRHRSSDLMGLIINVHSGDWIRRESGVGAGIDSYYEYVLKAYILLGDDNYLDRFNKHYDAVMRYVSQGPLLMDVHMHKPNAISRNFMDALLAFWPGLQVLKGDLVPAIETHEMLYQVLQRHNFIPEAFTTDFRVHWGHHPLRPEFIESTYFLYKATGDNYYLEVGKKVLDNLEEHARVECGLAAIKNVKTGAHEDQMDSYVLAEMFKYLYLLFSEKEDLVLDIDDFIFTTEAHLLPLSLSIGNLTAPTPKIRRDAYHFEVDITPPVSDNYVTTASILTGKQEEGEGGEQEEDEGGEHVCPALHTTHAAGHRYPHSVRTQVQQIVNRANPHRQRPPRMKASEFIAGNKEQLEQLHTMGIRIATMTDGRVQLLHTASEALSPEDAEDGMQFMQEMIELSKHQQQETQHDPMYVHITVPGMEGVQTMRAGPAQFGYDLKDNEPVSGMLAIARPFRACKEIENTEELAGHVVILERGDCMFVDKARNLQRIGAKAGIVIDHTEGSTSDTQPLFAMSGDGTNDVIIPMVFLYHAQGQQLLQLLADNSFLHITLSATPEAYPKSKDQASPDQVGSPEPHSVQAESGKTEDSPPPPLHNQKPVVPATNTGHLHLPDTDPDEDDDPFFDRIQDKFYHHEAQLRDLYYLQVGSRHLHINVEVRPSPTKPKPLVQRETTFSLDALPDGSKMMTFRLTYQSPGYERAKPQLNQMYVDAVHLLQLYTNFNDLPHATDYLRAVARCLEAGYFGLRKVDNDALTLLRGLNRELQYVHVFPSEPQKPDLTSGSGAAAESVADSDDNSYAKMEDFVESAPHSEQSSSVQSSSSDQTDVKPSQGAGDSPYVKPVSQEVGETGSSAYDAGEGRVKVTRESGEQSTGQQRRNHFSVRMSADSEDNIRVKLFDDDASVSQSQSFSVRDDQSDLSSAKPQPPTSHKTRDQAASHDDSQSHLSGSSVSQSHSSSQSGDSSSQSGKASSEGDERDSSTSGENGSGSPLGVGEAQSPGRTTQGVHHSQGDSRDHTTFRDSASQPSDRTAASQGAVTGEGVGTGEEVAESRVKGKGKRNQQTSSRPSGPRPDDEL